jgi:hypothetical protein
MTDLTRNFNILSQEFKKSNASKESINKLYDLVYELNSRSRNLEENYILASTHRLLGNRHEAEQILEKVLESCVGRQKERPLKLFHEIVHENKNFPRKDRIYRDLRDAEKIKTAPVLSFDNFVTRQDHEEFITSLSGNVKNIVIFNKYVETKSIDIFSKKKPDEILILKLIYYFEWLAGVKADLMAFYEKTESDFKIRHDSATWFDGLEIWEVYIVITEDGIMETDLLIQDYYNHNSGFCLSLKDDIITDLEYDPIL